MKSENSSPSGRCFWLIIIIVIVIVTATLGPAIVMRMLGKRVVMQALKTTVFMCTGVTRDLAGNKCLKSILLNVSEFSVAQIHYFAFLRIFSIIFRKIING